MHYIRAFLSGFFVTILPAMLLCMLLSGCSMHTQDGPVDLFNGNNNLAKSYTTPDGKYVGPGTIQYQNQIQLQRAVYKYVQQPG
jgi:hypothetical protein